MATPHYSTEDFVYNEMYIPKNTAVVLNCYDIHHNEEKYPDSYDLFAERELWLAVSRLLWAFGIRSLPDEPISLKEYEGESGRTPLPYRVMLIPRHDSVQALLEAEQEVTLMKL